MTKIDTDENKIIFYCKDCEDVVETNRLGKKYVYSCRNCGTKNVAFGTVKSITGFFKLGDKKEEVSDEPANSKSRKPGE